MSESLQEKRQRLRRQKAELQQQVLDLEQQIDWLDKLERPFEAIISSFGKRFSTFLESESKARAKFAEYRQKKAYKMCDITSVWLVQHHEDHSVTVLDEHHRYPNLQVVLPYPNAKRLSS